MNEKVKILYNGELWEVSKRALHYILGVDDSSVTTTGKRKRSKTIPISKQKEQPQVRATMEFVYRRLLELPPNQSVTLKEVGHWILTAIATGALSGATTAATIQSRAGVALRALNMENRITITAIPEAGKSEVRNLYKAIRSR